MGWVGTPPPPVGAELWKGALPAAVEAHATQIPVIGGG